MAAFDIKTFSFVKQATTGAQAITGLGFTPKAYILWGTQNLVAGTYSNNQWFFHGWTDGAFSVATFSASYDDQETTETASGHLEGYVVLTTLEHSLSNNKAQHTSFDGDGFTITWTQATSEQFLVHGIAFGGDDLEVASGVTDTVPSGTVTVTGLPFGPSGVLFSTVPSTATSNFPDTCRTPALGFADGTRQGAQFLVCEDNVGAADTFRYQRTDKCNAIGNTVGGVHVEGSLTALTGDGFTISYSGGGTACGSYYLAFGGIQCFVGSFNSLTATGAQAVTGPTFEGRGAIVMAYGAPSQTTVQTESRLSYGATDGATTLLAWIGDVDGADPTVSSRVMTSSGPIIRAATPVAAPGSTTTHALASFTGFTANGFNLNWTVAGTVREVIYIVFGDPVFDPTGYVAEALTVSESTRLSANPLRGVVSETISLAEGLTFFGLTPRSRPHVPYWSYGAQILSMLGATPYVSIGTAATHFPIARLTDGVMGNFTMLDEVTGAFAIELPNAVAPDYIAVFNHNFLSEARLQGSNSSTFSALIVDEVVAAPPRRPSFWVDLRTIVLRTAKYWRVSVTGNADKLALGQLVVGMLEQAERSWQWDYHDKTDYLERAPIVTELGAVFRARHQVKMRGKEVRFVSNRQSHYIMGQLSTIHRETSKYGTPVILIPDETEGDIWLLDWTDLLPETFDVDKHAETRILLQEQSYGKLTDGVSYGGQITEPEEEEPEPEPEIECVVLFEDDFEGSPATLLERGYIGEIWGCEIAAGEGESGSAGVQSVGDSGDQYYAEFSRPITSTPGATFEIQWWTDLSGSADNEFGWVLVQAHQTTPGTFYSVFFLYGGVGASGTDLELYDIHVDVVGFAAGVMTVGGTGQFMKVRVEPSTGIWDGGEVNPDGRITVSRRTSEDDPWTVVIDAEHIEVIGGFEEDGLNTWNRVQFGPMGRLDQIHICEEIVAPLSPCVSIFEDDFEDWSIDTLAERGYTDVIDCEVAAGEGEDGTAGVQSSGDAEEAYYAQIVHMVHTTAPHATFRVEWWTDLSASADNGDGHSLLECRMFYSWWLSLQGGLGASRTDLLLLSANAPYPYEVGSATGVMTVGGAGQFMQVRVKRSTFDWWNGTFNDDGHVTVSRRVSEDDDWTVLIDAEHIKVFTGWWGDEADGSDSNIWDQVMFGPMGRLDRIHICEEPPEVLDPPVEAACTVIFEDDFEGEPSTLAGRGWGVDGGFYGFVNNCEIVAGEGEGGSAGVQSYGDEGEQFYSDMNHHITTSTPGATFSVEWWTDLSAASPGYSESGYSLMAVWGLTPFGVGQYQVFDLYGGMGASAKDIELFTLWNENSWYAYVPDVMTVGSGQFMKVRIQFSTFTWGTDIPPGGTAVVNPDGRVTVYRKVNEGDAWTVIHDSAELRVMSSFGANPDGSDSNNWFRIQFGPMGRLDRVRICEES